MASTNERASGRFRSLAIVSGKGGSGKTLVAAALAQTLAAEGLKVVLVDADLGTGGLTYYLGFGAFERARDGLTEYLRSRSPAIPKVARARSDITAREPAMTRVALLPVGEHRLIGEGADIVTPAAIERLSNRLKVDFDVAIFDCRGGLDDESIAVCKASHDVLLVVETDAASIQASQYLTNKLYDLGLGKKIAGFVLNKVMDDPSSLAKAGTSFFKADYLGSIPFDIETTRGFIKGEIPPLNSLFSRHVGSSILPLFGVSAVEAKYKPLKPEEFAAISLRNPEESFGGFVVGSLSIYSLIIFSFATYSINREWSRIEVIFVAVAGAIFTLSALSSALKQGLGRIFRLYVQSFARIFSPQR